ncbi:glyoxalase superfamily protein [Ensifer aridi]|uniref:glyoxalase superfamily protein n=1 Tax=Ensifer aridi TaxID=1708715 RepID=UPI0003FC057C|nr:glyoxalase superfamily protein [Ensifer aridi]
MTHETRRLPSLDVLKDQAKRLRSRLASEGEEISHSKSLELIAAQYGFRDWDTLHAAASNRPPFNPWMLGSRVTGHYLGQAFEAEILSAQALGATGRYRLTFRFDEPVDVVTFESVSAFERTSNGRPHLELEW